MTLRLLRSSRSFAALLIFVSVLAGLGRGPALASGVSVLADAPICHSGPASHQEGPPGLVHHGCCETCALCAVALVPDGVADGTPIGLRQAMLTACRSQLVAGMARVRTPRQAQAPPPGPTLASR